MSEWGPWIEHDGKGTPVPNGTITHCRWDNGFERIAEVTSNGRPDRYNPWMWGDDRVGNIIRYRIRKPRGLTILENLIADLPAPVRKVDT